MWIINYLEFDNDKYLENVTTTIKLSIGWLPWTCLIEGIL